MKRLCLILMLAALCPPRAAALERKEQLPDEMLSKICGASMTRPRDTGGDHHEHPE